MLRVLRHTKTRFRLKPALLLTTPSFSRQTLKTEEVARRFCFSAPSLIAAAGCALVFAGTYKRIPLHCGGCERFRLGKVDDFEEGMMKEVNIGPEGNEVTILVHRHKKEFFATSAQCAHYKAALRSGISTAGNENFAPSVSCPLTDSAFDLRTGKVIRGPAIDGIATFMVTVIDGTVYVDIPKDDLAFRGNFAHVQARMSTRDPKNESVFALVGGGAAALSAADTLRQEGFTGRIVMLTKEAHLPYDRSILSKNLTETAPSLCLRDQSFFDKWGIEVMHKTVVTRLDTKGQEITYEDPDGGGKLKYDLVLVASGGSPRELSCPGSTLKNVFTLRTAEDAEKINKVVRKGQKMVVVGGSFIGMEIASSLRKRGCDVAIIALETVPFERVLGKKVGASFARLLKREGVQWFGSSQVRNFKQKNLAVNGVELEDGEILPADGIVVGAGVLPNTQFVEGVTLDKNGALVVGPTLQSEAAPTLYAAGDVCSFLSSETGEKTRLEHWNVAVQQGRVAARNMMGKNEHYTTAPFFCSDLFGMNLRFVGFAPSTLERVVVEGDVSGMKFITYYIENDEIRAVATVNRDPIAVVCSELMKRGMMPRLAELAVGMVNGDVLMERLKKLSKK